MARRPNLDPDGLPVVLRQSLGAKLKALVVGGWYAFMTVAGGVLAAGGGAETDAGTRMAGAVLIAIVGPLAVYWLLQLVPGSCRLRVAHDGLHVRHCFVPRHRRWEELERFYTRTFAGYRIPDWTGVAFVRRDGRGAGAATWLEGLFRVRGIFDTDLLPDTYGVPAKELRSFLNACDVRWSGEKLGSVPREIPATRGFFVLNFALLLAFIVGFLLAAAAAAAEGSWGTVVLMLLFASPFSCVLVKMVQRRRRFTISSKQR